MHTFVLGDCLGVLILLISMLHICLQYALPLNLPTRCNLNTMETFVSH